ncbi:hypothetical protein [Mesorhizobium sp. B4-1-4]|uniref:hypothetical protein n=1 Tax=Mesorhizobium sp. B4-1-4 TaxID=2589888 RepID=UPI00299F888E|nr:hypothetical protein [Mesorhizobium sp. B4-1-4]
MMAYDQPRFNTDENKQRAIDDFRDHVQPEGKPAGRAGISRRCRRAWGIPSIVMTADTYGHLFPGTNDQEELAAAEKSLLGT